ncbi:MAG: ABC transporter permease [Bacillota bacterium]|nr:ABC transporter permease [Bacillota bacterium]
MRPVVGADAAPGRQRLRLAKFWYRYSQNKASIVGLVAVVLIIALTVLAPYVTPYPEHAGVYVNFGEAFQPPSAAHWFGTDEVGRDIFTRTIFGYRFSLLLAVVVLGIGVPLGVLLGLVAGYYGGWVESAIMKVTDIVLSLPALAMALAVSAVLGSDLGHSMLALAAIWWTWHARLVHGMVRSLKNEEYVEAAKVMGAGDAHIMFREILPNCIPAILVKTALDAAFVTELGAGLSFLGLGVRPPTPALGTMVATGAGYLPAHWWMAVFPSLAILLLIFGLNWFADGLRDVLDVDL